MQKLFLWQASRHKILQWFCGGRIWLDSKEITFLWFLTLFLPYRIVPTFWGQEKLFLKFFSCVLLHLNVWLPVQLELYCMISPSTWCNQHCSTCPPPFSHCCENLPCHQLLLLWSSQPRFRAVLHPSRANGHIHIFSKRHLPMNAAPWQKHVAQQRPLGAGDLLSGGEDAALCAHISSRPTLCMLY